MENQSFLFTKKESAAVSTRFVNDCGSVSIDGLILVSGNESVLPQ